MRSGIMARVRRLGMVIAGTILIVIGASSVIIWVLLTQPTLGQEGRKLDLRARPDVLEVHVRMLAETFSPRDYTRPDNLDRAASYLEQEFAAAGGRVELQPYQVDDRDFGVQENTYRNVRAFFGPDSEPRIVVGAHYDVANPLPGADDNASGTAALLELAHMLGQVKDLEMQVELVAYTLEEPPFFRSPFMGSAVHARSLKEDGHEVRMMISLEMLGYFSDEPGSQSYPMPLLRLFYSDTGNYIAVVGQLGHGRLVRHMKRAMRGASDVPVETINAPSWMRGIDLSDHLNYWKLGWPAVMITDTAFYRNPAYHTERDTPESLDYARMALVMDGIFNAIVTLPRS